MKVLMICNTYFQIFVAIRMKNTIFVNDIVDVVISDRCGYYKEILQGLRLWVYLIMYFSKKPNTLCKKRIPLQKELTK